MINLRCLYCQTPFTVGRSEMLTALMTMSEKNQSHYDAQCPRCRRANSISRQRMELFFPNWQEAAKQAAKEVSAAAVIKTEPLPRSLKTAAVKSAATKKTTAASAKPSASKRQRASKPASAKKTTPASKPAPSKAKPSSKVTKKK